MIIKLSYEDIKNIIHKKKSDKFDVEDELYIKKWASTKENLKEWEHYNKTLLLGTLIRLEIIDIMQAPLNIRGVIISNPFYEYTKRYRKIIFHCKVNVFWFNNNSDLKLNPVPCDFLNLV